VSGLAVFVWLVVISLVVAFIIRGLAENNTTYILWGTLLAVVSAHFMVIVTAAVTAKLVVKMVRRALRKEIEELCRGGGSK
jgi:hypothetical protein